MLDGSPDHGHCCRTESRKGAWSQDLAWKVGVRPVGVGLKHTDLVWMELCEHYV